MLILAACARPAPTAQETTIPAGKGHWISVEQSLDVDSLAGRTLDFEYRVNGSVLYAKSTSVIAKYRLTCTPTPLQPTDRCGMTLTRVTALYADGHEQSQPATGHVNDNSDGREGFRIELSHDLPKTLVIPAGATATVYFDAPVVFAVP
jgi:hypothetical protein